MGDTGFEGRPFISATTDVSKSSYGENSSGFNLAALQIALHSDPSIAVVVRAWPTLSPSARFAVLKIVRG